MKNITREELIIDLTNKGVVIDSELTWANLCKFTKFDSFVTALAFGLNWQITDVNDIPIGHLRMAHFNVLAFPKDKE